AVMAAKADGFASRRLVLLPDQGRRSRPSLDPQDQVPLANFSCPTAKTTAFGWQIVPPITTDWASRRLKLHGLKTVNARARKAAIMNGGTSMPISTMGRPSS